MKCNKTKTGPSSGTFVEAERKYQEHHEQIKFLQHAADNDIAQLHIFDLSTFGIVKAVLLQELAPLLQRLPGLVFLLSTPWSRPMHIRLFAKQPT